MTFAELKKERYEARPGDLPTNPQGFPTHTSNYSDISAHLPIIEYFASQCRVCTEFGTRNGFSTVALVSGCDHVISYDLDQTPFVKLLEGILPPDKVWEFHRGNTLDIEITPTDLLFIDTLHTYHQVRGELNRHAHKVDKYIIFHDTFSHGLRSRDIVGQEGINRAIEEFVDKNPCWCIVYRVDFNNGLTILERKDAYTTISTRKSIRD